ncbi:hypothetical protein SAMN04487898_11029 [Pedobacter sp. ok626]|uniref:hypothetical protein n=1 Tax=Pedobacter sp. ok626 TaxID=1761882 RepID=UPI00088A40E8|nr:hypothetical protein [Pedobacter sp. ok626]SDK63192.1 hypothetical protein SAMN04487898_11029 [Pedobacter sp. ok626]
MVIIQGEYSGTQNFVCLDISFLEFLQMAFLYRDLENMLDEWDDGLDEEKIDGFKKEINTIKSNLYELYPFQYF